MSVRVLVLMGGRSSEHDVSLSSARGVMNALDPDRFTPIPVLIDREGAWSRDGRGVALCPGPDGRGVLVPLEGGSPDPVDVVFPVLHGPFGEDGTVQGLCEMAGLPCVGAGVAASAIAMDKSLFRCIAQQAGLPVAEGMVVTARDWAGDPAGIRAAAGRLGTPAFVKPARLGSSVGISRVTEAEALDEAIHLALSHDDRILVERGIVGREVEVGVLGDEELVVSPPGEIRYDAEWYDYETKYQAGRAELLVPAELPEQVVSRLQELAKAAFRAAGCEGMGRIDFFVPADGRPVVSELNTIPGFTPTSAYPSLMAAAGVGYGELVSRLVDLALQRARRQHALRR
ncbi:MAG: D-alanine--D-alanine ligase family protein [Thermoleophilia bacterium]